MIASLLDVILRHVKARADGEHAEWAAAMEAESRALQTPRERLGWALGCLAASYSMRPPFRLLGHGVILLLAMSVVGLFNWRTDEDGINMGVLVLSSAALGLAHPRRAWLAGLLVGLVVFEQSIFTAATGLHPIYERGPELLRRGPDFSLLALVVPAVLAALLGGWIGRTVFRRSR